MELSMNDQSSMCNQATYVNTPSAISSQESVDGHSHFNSLVGLPIDLYGQDHAHASHSHQQENILEQTTNDTYGQPSSISSASSALTLSLGSRLQQQLAKVGSMEYRQTWSLKTTPAGRQYWAHTASPPRISGKGCTGLQKKGARTQLYQRMGISSIDNVEMNHLEVNVDASIAVVHGWSTPSANEDAAGSLQGKMQQMMSHQVRGMMLSLKIQEERYAGLRVLTANWLMGFPAEWTCSGVTAMQSFRRSRKHS